MTILSEQIHPLTRGLRVPTRRRVEDAYNGSQDNMSDAYSARFNMVMQPQERAMLQALAEDAGLKESDIVRQLVRGAYRERFGDKKPGKPDPKYNSREVLEAKAKKTSRKA